MGGGICAYPEDNKVIRQNLIRQLMMKNMIIDGMWIQNRRGIYLSLEKALKAKKYLLKYFEQLRKTTKDHAFCIDGHWH